MKNFKRKSKINKKYDGVHLKKIKKYFDISKYKLIIFSILAIYSHYYIHQIILPVISLAILVYYFYYENSKLKSISYYIVLLNLPALFSGDIVNYIIRTGFFLIFPYAVNTLFHSRQKDNLSEIFDKEDNLEDYIEKHFLKARSDTENELLQNFPNRLNNILLKEIELILERFKLNTAIIFLYDEELRMAYSKVIYSNCEGIKQRIIISETDNIVGWVMKHKISLCLKEAKLNFARINFYENFNYAVKVNFGAIVPLIVQGNLIGLFYLDTYENYFNIEDSIFKNYIGHIQDIIKMVKDYRNLAILSNQYSTLLKLNNEITSATLDISRVVNLLLGIAKNLVAADRSYFILIEDWKKESSVIKHTTRLILDNIVNWVIEKEKSVKVVNIKQDYRFLKGIDARWILAENLKSVLAVPLIVRGALLGIIIMESTEPNFFKTEDEMIIEKLANQTSIIIKNAYVYSKAVSQLNFLQSLNDLAHNLLNLNDLTEVIEKICSEIEKVIDFSCISFYKRTKDNLIFSYGVNCEKFNIETKIKNIYFYETLFKKKESLLINNIESCEHINKLNSSAQSAILIPIFNNKPVQDYLEGFLKIDSNNRILTDEEKERIDLFSRLINKSIVNALEYQKMYNLIYVDDLTEIYNYRFFMEKLKEVYVEKQGVGLIIFDIDDFKLINDNYGHLTGNEILKAISKISKEVFENRGYVCRYGGEEFVWLCKNITEEELFFYAEKIRNTIEHYENQKNNIKITVSVGYSFTDNNDVLTTPLRLIEKADRSLYIAKKNGKNRVGKLA